MCESGDGSCVGSVLFVIMKELFFYMVPWVMSLIHFMTQGTSRSLGGMEALSGKTLAGTLWHYW